MLYLTKLIKIYLISNSIKINKKNIKNKKI
jgi:hypothetical protein